jgi:UPF0271 protein
VAARDEQIAHAVCDAAEVFGVTLLGMAATKHEEVYTRRGIAFQTEYYTDLDYADDGSLIITREHVAKDATEAARRAVRAVKEGKATSITGKVIPMRAECICVHSDTPGAVELAKAVRNALAPFLGSAAARAPMTAR